MANQEHLDLLMQGVEGWNQWRREHSDIRPDLSEIDLSNLRRVNLPVFGPDIGYLGASRWTRTEVSLPINTNLTKADLRGVNLAGTNLTGADLSDADLQGAILTGVIFRSANLCKADLRGAALGRSDFRGANLKGANFKKAVVYGAIFAEVDLSHVVGLDEIRHGTPSTIGIDTIFLSKGRIPEIFLRGIGAPDSFITYTRSLINQNIDYYTCFISYSSRDEAFAQRLYADLQSKGVRCWFAPHHMKTGDKIRDRIDESIRIYDKLLLVLSKHSVTSTWVEHEVEAALDKERLASERHTAQTVLFPITLDDTIMAMESSWPAKVRRERHITDFRYWRQHDAYQQALERLLHALKAEYKSTG